MLLGVVVHLQAGSLGAVQQHGEFVDLGGAVHSAGAESKSGERLCFPTGQKALAGEGIPFHRRKFFIGLPIRPKAWADTLRFCSLIDGVTRGKAEIFQLFAEFHAEFFFDGTTLQTKP